MFTFHIRFVKLVFVVSRVIMLVTGYLPIFLSLSALLHAQCDSQGVEEIVINTWNMNSATEAGWNTLQKTGRALDAVEVGCTQCEIDQCEGTVGYGGSPDEVGETTLDAMIMDGPSHDVGAVSDLRRVKQAISVARAVLTYTKHTLLTGESATKFALEMGFTETTLTTNVSTKIHSDWEQNNCQPNFRLNVYPDPLKSCGPYKPEKGNTNKKPRMNPDTTKYNHDTIGMIAIDKFGRIAGGTSTNGASHKVPGRVGDSPIAGAGAYVEQGVGGAVSTGDGDVMMRFLPSFHAVLLMEQGASPATAASVSLARITKHYPDFNGAVMVLGMNGSHGAACNGFDNFPYRYRTLKDSHTQLVRMNCTHGPGLDN